MPVNKQIVLDSRPTAKVSAANFRLVEKELPTTYDGYILVRQPLPLARSLHARAAQRRQELRAGRSRSTR